MLNWNALNDIELHGGASSSIGATATVTASAVVALNVPLKGSANAAVTAIVAIDTPIKAGATLTADGLGALDVGLAAVGEASADASARLFREAPEERSALLLETRSAMVVADDRRCVVEADRWTDPVSREERVAEV